MGTSASRPAPLSAPFQRMQSWDLKAARRLLQDYKDKDLDFGLDTQALSELIQDDKEWAETIILAFGSINGIVNALAFICGVCIVCSGPALEKAAMIFDALDFDATEQISMDEMTIVFLCCARGFCAISGVGSVPSDEALEAVTIQAYRELNKSSTQSISKAEFTTWILRFAAAGASGEITMDQMTQQFGISSKPIQEEEAPTSNNEEASAEVEAPSDAVHEAQAEEDVFSGVAEEEQARASTEPLEAGDACEKEMPVESMPIDEQTPDEAQASELSVGNEENAAEFENQEQSMPANELDELAMKSQEEPNAQSYEHEEEHAYSEEQVDLLVDAENAPAQEEDPRSTGDENSVEAAATYEDVAPEETNAPPIGAEYHDGDVHEDSYEPDHEQSFAAEDQTYAEDPIEQSAAYEEGTEQQPDYELEFSTETPRPDEEAAVAEQAPPQEPAADAYGDEEHEYHDDEPEVPTPRPTDEPPKPAFSVETQEETAEAEPPTPQEPAMEAEGAEEHEQYEDDHEEPTPRQAEEDAQLEVSIEIARGDEETETPQEPVTETDGAEEHYVDEPEASTSPQTDEDPQPDASTPEPDATNEDPPDAEAAHDEDEAYEETSFAAESTAAIQDEAVHEDATVDGMQSNRSDASDLNQFDKYDYTDPNFSAESGLPPPEDELLLSARSDFDAAEEGPES